MKEQIEYSITEQMEYIMTDKMEYCNKEQIEIPIEEIECSIKRIEYFNDKEMKYLIKEQIEKDRNKVKKGIKDSNNSKFSYLKYLKVNKEKLINLNYKLKIHNTLEILYYLEESFIIPNKNILKYLKKIKIELQKREDLFDCILKFLENKKIESKLYYWLPGYEINNIFMFLKEIMPDFVERYKNYFIKPAIIGQNYKNCFEFIKKLFIKDYPSIRIMKQDLIIFNNCLSLNYWPHKNLKYKKGFLNIDEKINISDDLKGIIIPDLSYVDFNIGNFNFIVTIDNFEGLMSKNDDKKEFWEKQGVIDNNWNILLKN